MAWCKDFKTWKNRLIYDEHWKKTKEIVWQKRKHECAFCHKKYDLEFHHISYKRVCHPEEWKDIRILCSNCHKKAGFFLWIFKLKGRAVYIRYYELRIHYFMWAVERNIVRWLILSYWHNLSKNQKRKIENWGKF